MAEIHILRSHDLGLEKARKAARRWTDEAAGKLALEFMTTEGEDGDVVEFKRAGVRGRLLVAADRFELDAKLGLLLGAFSRRIEAEIAEHFDVLLAVDNSARQ